MGLKIEPPRNKVWMEGHSVTREEGGWGQTVSHPAVMCEVMVEIDKSVVDRIIQLKYYCLQLCVCVLSWSPSPGDSVPAAAAPSGPAGLVDRIRCSLSPVRGL